MNDLLVVFILLNTIALFVFGIVSLAVKIYTDDIIDFNVFLIYIVAVNLCFVFTLGFSYFAFWLDNSLK